MLAVRLRSGLEETFHDGAVAVCRPDGSLVASAGDIDRPFYIRSAAKPFQAFVSQELGAELNPIELAVAAASHRGHPVHIALVENILRQAGLDQSDLRCPPDWPLSRAATRRLAGRGETDPRPLWHNCSGKHAGFLRACVSSDWPTDSYLDPGHQLQKVAFDLFAELGDFDPGPVGVDGCGAPVFRTTARVLARLYAALGSEARLRPIFESMHRYPALVAENGAGDAMIATSLDVAAKGGTAGCIGVAIRDRYGVAVRSWDGSGEVAAVGAVAALDEIGVLGGHPGRVLKRIVRPDVLGGGRPVGELESRLELNFQ